jgi:hypothetical protein
VSRVPAADGYHGSAQLLDGELVLDVVITLTGRFDPISGAYHWYGRVAPSPQVAALVASGSRTLILRTPYADVRTALSDVDPWGRPRVEGFGAAPFAVLETVPADAS